MVLKVEGLTAMYSGLKDVSFELQERRDSGRSRSGWLRTHRAFGKHLCSATRKSGKLWMNGKPIHNHSPKESIRNGFAMVTEERRATGIFAIMSVRDNTVISSLKKYLKNHLYLSNKTMQERTNWSINAMHIKTPTQQTQIRSLSGGNQQKVIFGRWMLTEPETFLLDEPTRGIDVGAKYEIYQLIMDMARRGQIRHHGFLRNAGIAGRVRPHTGDVRRAACRRGTGRRHHSGRDYDAGCEIRLREAE